MEEHSVELQPYGFRWEGVTVTRACQHKGNLILLVQSSRESVQVRITPKGSIRIYREGIEQVIRNI